RLSSQEQSYHATIWGQTGSGKSRLLQSLFLQHLRQGKGICMLEPHHDLSFDTLSALSAAGFFHSPEAFDKLIYLDWGNGAYVPFNILSGSEEPEVIASNALEAFMRVWPELR